MMGDALVTSDAERRSSDEQPPPVTVRVGEVVAPEEPEEWRRPLTWLAAAGMLAAPLAALAWFSLWPPSTDAGAHPGTWLLAALLPLGAALTGSTQRGGWRAFAASLGAGLFAALATVIVAGAEPTSQRQALLALVSGGVGVLVVAGQAPLLARLSSRARRAAVPGLIGAAVSALVVALLTGTGA